MPSTQIFRILARGFGVITSLLMWQKQSMILGTVPNLRRLDCNDSNSFSLFQINGDEIESTGDIKYLGAQIDLSLN